jgi:ketosteroid isomerase-like protein
MARVCHRRRRLGSIDERTDDPGPVPGTDASGVLEANAAFYRAFESGDLDAMSDLWEHSDRVTCVHPGWGSLRGWSRVAASWAALFNGGSTLQFILTDEAVVVTGDMAMVTLDENILGGTAGSTVAAMNVFVRSGDDWRMVAHHGSPVADRVRRQGP